MRGVRLPSGREVILSDTVGFISDLPTQLVAAFRATLEEVLSADLILHVRDISHAETEAQAEDVEAILTELGVDEEVPRFEIWNKIDLLDSAARDPLEVLAGRRDEVLAVSALTGEGLDAMLDAVSGALDGARRGADLRLGFEDGRRRAWLYDQGVVERESRDETGLRLHVRWTPRQEAEFHRL